MCNLLAIDPGADQGWAYFVDGTLMAAGLGDFRGRLPGDPTHAIIERPTLYPGSRARPADIITLALRAGMAAGLVYAEFHIESEYIEPRSWKGSVPKSVHHARITHRLTTHERKALEAATSHVPVAKRHNILDAVGLGQWASHR